jgi:filamentous hemagglutinin
LRTRGASDAGYGAIGGAVSAASANEIATIVTGGQGNPDGVQLAVITAATMLLGGGTAALLGQNSLAAVAAAQNETLNNTCGSENPNGCGQKLAAAGAAAGGAVAVVGSVAVDGATGGLNIIATPAEVAGGSAFGALVGGTVGAGLDWLASSAIFNQGSSDLPTDLVGEQDSKSGQQGNRQNSGRYHLRTVVREMRNQISIH